MKKAKKALRVTLIVLISLAVWCGACFVCYAYGMHQEETRLREMLDPALAEGADSTKWITAVEEPMTDDELKEHTKTLFEDMEFQIKCYQMKDANGDHITFEDAVAQGYVQGPAVEDMAVYTTSDPERGWVLRVVESPMGTVSYRAKDEFVTSITRNYTADSPSDGLVESKTEAAERARAYYNWGLPFPTNYELQSVEQQADGNWLATYYRTVNLKDLPKLRSSCQQVTITISAADGEMISAQCLDLLLVQVGTDQQPIEKEDAVQVADAVLARQGVEGYVLQDAVYAVVEPNYLYTVKEDGTTYDPESHLSRAVWKLHYLPADMSQPGFYEVYVDAYTGQELGGFYNQYGA